MDDLIRESSKNFKFGKAEDSLLKLIGAHSIARLKMKFPEPSSTEFLVTLRELVRFLYLSAHAPSTVFFPGNKLMDDLWHALIIETAEYRTLCGKIKHNSFIDHSGTTFADYLSLLAPGKIHEEQCSWLASYFKNFGPIGADAYSCLPLAQSLAKRMSANLDQLNSLAKVLSESGEASCLPFDFDSFIEMEVKRDASRIDRDPSVLSRTLNRLLSGCLQKCGTGVNLVSLEELEKVFGASTALAFTLWQHLSAVERLDGLKEWQLKEPQLWRSIASGETLCGLATTHLARPGGSSLTASEVTGGYLIQGEAPWVCGHTIFEKLLVGFETDKAIVFALIDFPIMSVSGENNGTSILPNELVCLNGTSTVRILFSDKFVAEEQVISSREKTAAPVPRPSRYVIPELGIAKSAINDVDAVTSNSSNPRHKLIAASLKDLRARLAAIQRLRETGAPLEQLVLLRDEINRDAVRMLTLALGAKALLNDSAVARAHMELFLLDTVLHSPKAFEYKIQKTGSGFCDAV